jgi:hypothetical protein
MPNLTPKHYRQAYAIYPKKAGTQDGPSESDAVVRRQLAELGRSVGSGRGDAPNMRFRQAAAAQECQVQEVGIDAVYESAAAARTY